MSKSERSAHTTTDHDFIRRWVEERGGKPSRVKRTGGGDDPVRCGGDRSGEGAAPGLRRSAGVPPLVSTSTVSS